MNEAGNMSSVCFSNMLIFCSTFLSITHQPNLQLDRNCLLELCILLWTLYAGKLRGYILNNAPHEGINMF